MGFLPLSYRRPEYVDKEEFQPINSIVTENEESNASLKSGSSRSSSGIPDALTFDKVMSGATCPPCTIRDFMNYLLYVEHAAENLQFLLWYRDYIRRFNRADTLYTDLSPRWTQAMEDETAAKIQRDAIDRLRREPQTAITIPKGTDFEKEVADVVAVENKNPFSTPPRTPSVNDASSCRSGSQVSGYRTHIQDVFSAAGTTQPFTVQPFRAELNRIIATYIMVDSPRQLNLSSRQRKLAVQALAHTTHPSALRSVARSVEDTLRRQAHPNFIRWSIGNGNRSRACFAQVMGAATVGISTVGAILLSLSGANRGWRVLFAVGWTLGIATMVAAGKGMCVILHGMHRRHVRPWELFDCSTTDVTPPSEAPNEEGSELEEGRRNGAGTSLDSFGSSNSYEDEPWVVRYERRNVVRKVFDREVWVQEPALRQIQDVIFMQSVLVGLLGAGVLTAVFVSVPAGRFF
ncbi:hypothetical protein GGR53DRAFT_518851 [Hypoxylon sp. FL1150]|nr:hypothetical protein GGR53DRAFT_518851 [Hypoxylon sp. FL1150]